MGKTNLNLIFLFCAALAATGCKLTSNNDSTTQSQEVVHSGSGSGGSGSSGSSGSTTPQPLSVASISPTKGSFKSGALVTLTGTGFTARTRIQVDGTLCADVAILSSTEATCFAPPHALGPVQIRAYEYTAPATTFDNPFMYVTDGFSLVTGKAGASGDYDWIDDPDPLVARFNDIRGLTLDGKILYVSDYGNNAIRKYDTLTGAVTTLAGDRFDDTVVDGDFSVARFHYLGAMTQVGQKLFVIDHYCIRELDLTTQQVATRAGDCAQTGAVNAVGTAARFYFDAGSGITNDGANLYVSDSYNNMIRKISLADFTVTTLAGQRTAGRADLPGTSAKFNLPYQLTYMAGKVYVADYYNYSIRSVNTTTAAVATVAGGNGSGYQDGTLKTARIRSGYGGLTNDGTDLYLVDYYSYVVRRVIPATGEIRLLAGVRNIGGGIDGMIDTATLDYPRCIVWSPTDGLFLGEYTTIRQVQ